MEVAENIYYYYYYSIRQHRAVARNEMSEHNSEITKFQFNMKTYYAETILSIV